MKKAAFFLSQALLLLSVYAGITNAIRDIGTGETFLQRTVTVAVAMYGVLGLVGVIGLWRRRPWVVPVVLAWGLASMWAATVASFAYHDPGFQRQGTAAGVMGAFVGVGLVCGFVLWVARVRIRNTEPAPTVSHSLS